METAASMCNTNLRQERLLKLAARRQKEYRKRKKIEKQQQQAAKNIQKKIPLTNAQLQQRFREKQKRLRQEQQQGENCAKNIQIGEMLLLARKKNAARAKRYRDKLKSKKQQAELDSFLSSNEDSLPTVLIENKKETDHHHDTNCEELNFSRFQMQTNQIQPSMNNLAQQVISPSFQSFGAPYEERDECSMPNALLNHEPSIAGADLHRNMVQNHRWKAEGTFWTEETLFKAVEAVKNKEISGYRAAIKYNIPRTTIMNYVNGRYVTCRRGKKSLTNGRPRVLSSNTEKRPAEDLLKDQTKAVISNVYHYVEQEYVELKKIYKDLDLTPLSRCAKRTALATGVSETTVLQILDEAKQWNAANREEPRQKRGRVSEKPEEAEPEQAVPAIVPVEVKAEPRDDEVHGAQCESYIETLEVKIEPPDVDYDKTQTETAAYPLAVKVEPRDDEENKSSVLEEMEPDKDVRRWIAPSLFN